MRLQITVPPNTLKTNPLVQEFMYGGARMTREIFIVPLKHAYQTGLQMFAGNQLQRVYPEGDSNTEWLTADNEKIEKKIVLEFDPPSFKVVIKTYNEDDTFPHTFYLELDEG